MGILLAYSRMAIISCRNIKQQAFHVQVTTPILLMQKETRKTGIRLYINAYKSNTMHKMYREYTKQKNVQLKL